MAVIFLVVCENVWISILTRTLGSNNTKQRAVTVNIKYLSRLIVMIFKNFTTSENGTVIALSRKEIY